MNVPNDPAGSPDDARRQIVEGEYLAPDANPASGRNWKAAGGTAIGVGIAFAKFKTLFFALLNFKWLLIGGKFALTGVSFLASIWFYSLFYGWTFAFVFVVLIGIHELGHVVFVRAFGLSAPAVYFVPAFGAFTTWKDPPKTVFAESAIAFAGPLFGGLAALGCYVYGSATGSGFWIAAAYVAFFLNLFNMIPLGMLDGGKMTGAISPRLWIVGFAFVVVAAIAFHWWSPILLIVMVLSIPRVISVFRGSVDERFLAVSSRERAIVSIAYFGLIAFLTAGVVATHVVPGQTFGS